MVKHGLLCLMALLPVGIALLPAESIPVMPEVCDITTINVREEPDKTTITHGRWNMHPAWQNGHGYYYGVVQFFTPDGEKQREINVDRSLIFSTRLHDGYLEGVTLSTSRLSGDNLDDSFIGTYVSPVLVSGHKTLSVLFKTPGGTYLSGLNDRPRLKCNAKSAVAG